jgi:hypothetical protein
MGSNWETALVADYGHDVTTPGGAARHLRSVSGSSSLRLAPIADDADYGRIVRRLHRRREIDHPLARPPETWGFPPPSGSYVDGRLLAAGYCLSTPTRWAAELQEWLTYYASAVARPSKVGSSYNSFDPTEVAIARQIGCPAWVLRTMGRAVLRPLRIAERARQIRSSDVATRRLGTARIPQRLVTRLRRAARAMARTSWGGTQWIGRPLCMAARVALGRVSPEVQRAILEHLEAHPVEGTGPLRVRDLPWAVGQRVARDCAASPVARAAWAVGQRRAALAAALATAEQVRLAHPLSALLARGLPPVEAVDRYIRRLPGYDSSAPRLTAREARQFSDFALRSRSGHECPTQWLASGSYLAMRRSPPCLAAGAIGVARWLCAVMAHAPRRESLLRPRRVRHPRPGELVEISLTARLDELRWSDVAAAGGLRAGVDAVFEAASFRLGDGVLGGF